MSFTTLSETFFVSGEPGCLMLAPGSRFQATTVSWRGETIFKPVGTLEADDDDVAAHWGHGLSGFVRAAGTRRRITFIDDLPHTAKRMGFSPYGWLRDSVAQWSTALKPEWRGLFMGTPSRSPAMPFPATIALMQGWLYRRAEQDLMQCPETRVVLLATSAVRRSLMSSLADPARLQSLLNPSSRIALRWGPAIPSPLVNPTHVALPDAVLTEVSARAPLPVDAGGEDLFRRWDEVLHPLTSQEQRRALATAFDHEVLEVGMRGSSFR